MLAPVVRGRKGEYAELLRELQVKGYSRARVDGTVIRLDSVGPAGPAGEPPALKKHEKHDHRGGRGPAGGQGVGPAAG